MFRWLLFRLLFASGIAKLTSGDPTWRDLTALAYHYFTQPIPNPVAWYAHHLPTAVHAASAAGLFAVEILAPLLFFAPRRLKLISFGLQVALQLCILATGNYAYFNLLTILLALWLVDDRSWPVGRADRQPAFSGPSNFSKIQVCFAVVVVLVGSMLLFRTTFRSNAPWSAPLITTHTLLSPYHLINSYGLFQVMTTARPEIILEGSADGENWKAYTFPYKAGDLETRPPFVAPHQPRLDWQMWFAALRGDPRRSHWFYSFSTRILQGSPAVIRLLDSNPFPGAPPAYLRARLFRYRFTTPSERRDSGRWWERAYIRDYLPPTRNPFGVTRIANGQ